MPPDPIVLHFPSLSCYGSALHYFPMQIGYRTTARIRYRPMVVPSVRCPSCPSHALSFYGAATRCPV
eukprot:1618905-Rhodomonas_salina.2